MESLDVGRCWVHEVLGWRRWPSPSPLQLELLQTPNHNHVHEKSMVHSLERNMRIKLYQYALTIGKSSYRHFAGICQLYCLTCCKVGRIGAACARSSVMPFGYDATCSPTTQHIPAIQEQDYQKHFLPPPTFIQDDRPTD
jgi:hypothetical protein